MSDGAARPRSPPDPAVLAPRGDDLRQHPGIGRDPGVGDRLDLPRASTWRWTGRCRRASTRDDVPGSEPSASARFAIYASIGLGVFLLFTISLAVERRIRNRDYAPEWRR